jgi:O-antigen chain-terminating methyltransferase
VNLDPRLAAQLEFSSLTGREYVERAYRLFLRREPLPEDLERCVSSLERGTLSRATLLHELTSSGEFVRVRALDDALARARQARLADERPRELTAPPATDERAVEIAWVLSRYRGEPRVLDVGYAFAEPAYLAELIGIGAGELVGVDLAAADVPGLRAVAADIRELPFEDSSFDVVFCISTLEHIGRDNRAYGLGADTDPAGVPRALGELGRVLVAGGRLLITVPCGEPADLGSFVQRDPGGWRELFEGSGLVVFEEEIYELGGEGWRSVPAFEPVGVRYGERGPGASAVLCAELRPGRALQGMRRAVGRITRPMRVRG